MGKGGEYMFTQSPIVMGDFILEVNAYWVTVSVHGHVVFKRVPSQSDWLDAQHRAFTDALDALEKATKGCLTT